MSDGAFHAFAGLLALSGLALAVEALLGRGRRIPSRVIDALFALALLAGTAYVVKIRFRPEPTYFAGFVLTALLLLRAERQRRGAKARRFAAGIFKQMYEAPAAPTPLTPFPPAPPPLGATNGDEHPESGSPQRHHRETYEPRPSGLPQYQAAPLSSPAAQSALSSASPSSVSPSSAPSSASSPAEPPRRGPMPSGLPSRENWPPPPPPSAGTPGRFAGYERPRHAGTPGHAAGHEQPAYPGRAQPGPGAPGSGRHRAPDAAEPEPGAGDDPPPRPY